VTDRVPGAGFESMHIAQGTILNMNSVGPHYRIGHHLKITTRRLIFTYNSAPKTKRTQPHGGAGDNTCEKLKV